MSVHSTQITEIDATEITLKNGIKVCIKPLANSEDIQLRAVAPAATLSFLKISSLRENYRLQSLGVLDLVLGKALKLVTNYYKIPWN